MTRAELLGILTSWIETVYDADLAILDEQGEPPPTHDDFDAVMEFGLLLHSLAGRSDTDVIGEHGQILVGEVRAALASSREDWRNITAALRARRRA